MSKPFIHVAKLTKDYSVRSPTKGVWRACKSLLSPSYSTVKGVDSISFQINRGERVALIGPNGAGKSTTIKMLTGILRPSSGDLEVAGFLPWRDREALSQNLGCVFGQRSQLWYHLTAAESYEIFRRIYRIEASAFSARLSELVRSFDIAPLLQKRPSGMSLGERMRCELIACLLHAPSIVMLDEPSIGLDAVARLSLRDFIREYAKKNGVTVLLTSHDTGDIESVCDRAIVVDHGKVVTDTTLAALKKTANIRRRISVRSEERDAALDLPGVNRVESEPHRSVFEVDAALISIDAAVAKILQSIRVTDISVEDPPLEAVIVQLYRRGATSS